MAQSIIALVKNRTHMQSSEANKIVFLSPRAIEKVKEILNNRTSPEVKKPNGLRVFATQGCCSNQYGMTLENQVKSGDIQWNESGISVYVDGKSAALLKDRGLTLLKRPRNQVSK